jgi:putative transposase
MRLDGTQAHGAQGGQVPDNVVLIPLPASSPALYPAERLWEDLKHRIDVLDSQVRTSLPALRDHVADIVRRSTAEAVASLTGYPYLVEVARAL